MVGLNKIKIMDCTQIVVLSHRLTAESNRGSMLVCIKCE